MPERFSPVQILIVLVLAAVAVSGWVYGWRWKQVAMGNRPMAEVTVGMEMTDEESLIISLQDQLDRLRSDNEALSRHLRELEEARGGETPPASGTGTGNSSGPDEPDRDN